MNLSLDLHGVITHDPTTFRTIARKVIEEGGEVTVISGSLPDHLLQQLIAYDIPHTRWVSSTQYLLNRGYPWEYDQHHRPVFASKAWSGAKGKIIQQLNLRGAKIDIHVDDSAVYGETFPPETLFYHYTGDISYEILLKRLASRA